LWYTNFPFRYVGVRFRPGGQIARTFPDLRPALFKEAVAEMHPAFKQGQDKACTLVQGLFAIQGKIKKQFVLIHVTDKLQIINKFFITSCKVQTVRTVNDRPFQIRHIDLFVRFRFDDALPQLVRRIGIFHKVKFKRAEPFRSRQVNTVEDLVLPPVVFHSGMVRKIGVRNGAASDFKFILIHIPVVRVGRQIDVFPYPGNDILFR